jgi:glycosyltransferase involved in cell wall biosynthesis
LIRQQYPNVQLDLFTHHRPEIDWSLDDVYSIFNNVYLSPVEILAPAGLAALCETQLPYNVIDLQFHQAGYNMEAYRRIGDKIIFTPMESLTKVLYIDLRTKFSRNNSWRLSAIASALRFAAEEISFSLKADEVICVSHSDAALLRIITSSRRVRGLDTGISRVEFSEALSSSFISSSASERSLRILFIAYFGSETNVNALRWYLDNVHPIVKANVPDYIFTVVGRGDLTAFSKYIDSSVEFVGEVPFIAPHIKDARIGIAPALSGSGFRGKVNQYAVLGVPCVASPIAFKGLAYQDGINIFVAETPAEFADKCIVLLTDELINDRMGQAARQLCMERYTWESKWPDIREIYKLKGAA